jgi:hypothetical protein
MRLAGRVSRLRGEAGAIIEETPPPCQSAIRAVRARGDTVPFEPAAPTRLAGEFTRRVLAFEQQHAATKVAG